MKQCRNIELKARLASLDRARDVARAIRAEYVGMLRQIDTYFSCPNGRLKLREIAGQGAELIWYARSDEGKPRPSLYMICEVEHPATLSSLLDSALGSNVTVEKQRDLFLWQNVRIHLDDVTGLGTFVEFEAVMQDDADDADDAEAYSHLRFLTEKFEISASDVLTGSYSDML